MNLFYRNTKCSMYSKYILIPYYAKGSSTNNNNNIPLILKSYNQILWNKYLLMTNFSFKEIQSTSLSIYFLSSSYSIEFLEDIFLFFIKSIISKLLLIIELFISFSKVIYYIFDFIQSISQHRYIKVLKTSLIVVEIFLNSNKYFV